MAMRALPNWAATRQFYRQHVATEWADIPELQHPREWTATQLQPGKLVVGFRIAWSGSSGVSELALDGGAAVRSGANPHQLSIVMPILGNSSRLFWTGLEARDGAVINTANQPEHWSLRGPGRLLVFSLDASAPFADGGTRRAPQLVYHPDRQQRRAFQTLLERVLDIAECDRSWIEGSRGALIQNDLGILALDLLRSSDDEHHASRSVDDRRRRSFEELLNFFENGSADPLTLAAVAEALGSSKRSLNYVCHDFFGLAPMELLRISRLNAVRRILRQAQPGSVSIWKLAGDFGFWHPGRFSVAYRDHFGETPSQTLRGPRVFAQR